VNCFSFSDENVISQFQSTGVPNSHSYLIIVITSQEFATIITCLGEYRGQFLVFVAYLIPFRTTVTGFHANKLQIKPSKIICIYSSLAITKLFLLIWSMRAVWYGHIPIIVSEVVVRFCCFSNGYLLCRAPTYGLDAISLVKGREADADTHWTNVVLFWERTL
jgi:hypothetical protein